MGIKYFIVVLFLLLATPKTVFGQDGLIFTSHQEDFDSEWDSLSSLRKKPDFFHSDTIPLDQAGEPENNGKLTVNGYLKYLPSYRKSSLFDRALFDQLLHNRLNFKKDIHDNFTFQGSLRTRFFYGGTIEEFPFFKEFLDDDFGAIDLSKVIWSGRQHILHTTIDRFNFTYKADKWELRLGRQRINWGINLVSNPNDLFNTYSFFDFDYEERPGTDAIRFQYFTGDLSRFEIAYAPGKNKYESVAAAYYSFNSNRYDIQFISGVFKNRWTGGFGWAGSIKNTGFKGEVSYFRDLQPIPGREPGNIVAGISADHILSNGTFLVIEYLYNQPRSGVGQEILVLTQPLQADNLSFSDHSVFFQAQYPISPILNAGAATIYYPSEKAVFLSPSITGNIVKNLDLLLIGQFFTGSSSSIFSQAGSLIAASLKWNF